MQPSRGRREMKMDVRSRFVE
uniref:Uncharacterized protein n=1 Tax=Arundo donax TaxID=35708 RepID=A0A0A9GK89_ARUDO